MGSTDWRLSTNRGYGTRQAGSNRSFKIVSKTNLLKGYLVIRKSSTQYLTIKDLYFKYQHSSIPIFEDLNLEFQKGWSCIVGANGSGKSTLLKLISKEMKAQNGTINGNDLSYYCAQSTELMPDNLENFMFTYTSNAFKIRDLLGIQDSWGNSWDILSHGERKRVQLALSLFEEPDVLLIDEPTNHLDNKSKSIVIQALKSFKGIGILVSHDRELLDTLARTTVILKNQEIRIFKTSYTNAISEYYKNIEHLQNDKLKQNSELKKLKKSIQIQHEKVSQSKKRMSKKTLKSGDSDAKGKIDMARFTGKDKNDGQLVAKLQAKEKKILDDINDLPREIKGEIYTIIQRLSSDSKKLQDSHSPSPGELRKLMIAQGLLKNPSLIILDEPTNHMDLDSIISLELALKEYNGAMIIISHDKQFLDAIVTDIWEFTKEKESTYLLLVR